MTSTTTVREGTRPGARALGVLVLALVAGLLAMHALMPPMPAAPVVSAEATTAAGSAGPPTASAPHHVPGGCGHHGGAPGGGHLDHADPTCAAAGTAATWTSPGLAPALSGAEPEAAVPHARHAAPRATDRAPPDLADLQLLRI